MTDRQSVLSQITDVLDEFRQGKPVIMVDDEDRENEGDLIYAAEKITPQGINFMAREARGLICLALTNEFARTRVEVSLLTPPEPFPVADEADALARLRPGIDGLILSYGRRRATFLPQVWESLPEARQFIAQLKLKAGLPADFWHQQITLARYGVRKWEEN